MNIKDEDERFSPSIKKKSSIHSKNHHGTVDKQQRVIIINHTIKGC